MEIECCCCEQPISNQKIIFTAISLDAHNNNIRNPAQNSASGNEPLPWLATSYMNISKGYRSSPNDCPTSIDKNKTNGGAKSDVLRKH